MNESQVSAAKLPMPALVAGALGALVVVGMIGAGSRAGAEVQTSPVPSAAYVVAQADPVASLTASVNWVQIPAAADPSAAAVAAYGN